MLRSQQIKFEIKHFFYGFIIISTLIIFLSWYFFLLIKSRPIVLNSDVLGASTSSRQDLNIKLASYPIIDKNLAKPSSARSWALFDADSQKIIAGTNEARIVPIASTTKIMTAILVLENIKDLNDTVEIEKNTLSIYQSQPHLYWGENYTVKDLLYLMMLESDNQAANTLAVYVGGRKISKKSSWSERRLAFINLMNKKADDLNLSKTKYSDPAGLETSTTSTASELAILTAYSLKNDQFRQIVSTPTKTISNLRQTRYLELKNTNRLVSEWFYPGIIGVKTGFLPNESGSLSAGHCLVAASKQNNHILIAVILNTYSELNSASAQSAKEVLDFGFKNINWY